MAVTYALVCMPVTKCAGSHIRQIKVQSVTCQRCFDHVPYQTVLAPETSLTAWELLLKYEAEQTVLQHFTDGFVPYISMKYTL